MPALSGGKKGTEDRGKNRKKSSLLSLCGHLNFSGPIPPPSFSLLRDHCTEAEWAGWATTFKVSNYIPELCRCFLSFSQQILQRGDYLELSGIFFPEYFRSAVGWIWGCTVCGFGTCRYRRLTGIHLIPNMHDQNPEYFICASLSL